MVQKHVSTKQNACGPGPHRAMHDACVPPCRGPGLPFADAMALMVTGIAACHCIHGTTDKGLEKEEAMGSLKNKDKSTKLPA